ANAVPTGIDRLACGASTGAWLVCTTVTLNDVVALLPLLSTTRAVNGCVPSCAALGTQSTSGAGVSVAPEGAVGSENVNRSPAFTVGAVLFDVVARRMSASTRRYRFASSTCA